MITTFNLIVGYIIPGLIGALLFFMLDTRKERTNGEVLFKVMLCLMPLANMVIGYLGGLGMLAYWISEHSMFGEWMKKDFKI